MQQKNDSGFHHHDRDVLLLMSSTGAVAVDEDNPFGLWVGPSEYGRDMIKVRGFLPEKYGARYFSLRITGYENGTAPEKRELPLPLVPEFNVKVDTTRTYTLTMLAFNDARELLLASETLANIHGARFTGAFKQPAAPVIQRPPMVGISAEGLEASLDEIQCDKFPYINALVTVKRDGTVIDNLTESNFTVLEDGLCPAVVVAAALFRPSGNPSGIPGNHTHFFCCFSANGWPAAEIMLQ